MLLSYSELVVLVEAGIIQGSDLSRINSTSIDVTLGNTFLREVDTFARYKSVVALSTRDAIQHEKIVVPDSGVFILEPGEFVLAQTREVFNLPLTHSAEYKMRSSAARIGLEQLGADWCSAGWHGSVLTLELKNLTRFHRIELRPGDVIGQMVFYTHRAVPLGHAYNGVYNDNPEVSTARVLA